MSARTDSAGRKRGAFSAARGGHAGRRPGDRLARGLMVLLFGVLGGCVADGGYVGDAGYDGGAEIGYGVDYYEPYGYEYGGCCDRYRVGPPRRDFDHDHPDHGHFDQGRGDQRGGGDRGHFDQGRGDQGRGNAPERRDAHPYRSAAPSRPAPSIPTGPRGGGGGHPGGHGH